MNETYKSLVLYSKQKDIIIVSNIDGPLKHLKNEWVFKEINNQTFVEFKIEIELKNKLFDEIVKKFFNIALDKVATAFASRANHLFK